MNDIAHIPSHAAALAPASRIPAWCQGIVGTLDGALQVAQVLAKSGMVPEKYTGKPEAIVVAAAMGHRLGLDLFSSLAGIAVINGRPSIWGDAMLAVCQAHPEWSGMEVQEAGAGDAFACTVTVHRKGHAAPYSATFSMRDAKTAGLAGKQGPWSQYPQRMCRNRAQSWALRAAFADALAGIQSREEMDDIADVTADARVIATEPARVQVPTVDPGKPTDPPPQEQSKPVRKAPHPALKAGNDLWADLEQLKKGLGSQVISRLAKIHGADAPKAIPADRLDAFGRDLGTIATLKTEAEIEDELGAMEVAAREAQP